MILCLKMLMTSLLDNIDKLTSNEAKMIFKTELNSLEITRLKPKSFFVDVGDNEELSTKSRLFDPKSLLPELEKLQENTSLDHVESTPPSQAPRLQYSCPQCKYATNKKSNYDMHMKCVHLKEKFACTLCNKSYSNIAQHMRVIHLRRRETKQKPLPLPIEDYSCTEVRQLHSVAVYLSQQDDLDVPAGGISGLSPIKANHPPTKLSRKECHLCSKFYSNLEQHIKIIHKKIKNFECVNCKKRFYDNRELRNHHLKSLQTGQCQQWTANVLDRRFACDSCEYKARTRHNLTLHVESIHLRIKHTCSACGLKVSSKSNLSNHQKNCKQFFSQNQGERDSKRIMFKCKLCAYSTPRPSHLDRHILSVHGTEAFKTVTSVYQASTRTSSVVPPTSTKVPFKLPKLPQFFNLVSSEGWDNFLPDCIGTNSFHQPHTVEEFHTDSVEQTSRDLHSSSFNLPSVPGEFQNSSIGTVGEFQSSSLEHAEEFQNSSLDTAGEFQNSSLDTAGEFQNSSLDIAREFQTNRLVVHRVSTEFQDNCASSPHPTANYFLPSTSSLQTQDSGPTPSLHIQGGGSTPSSIQPYKTTDDLDGIDLMPFATDGEQGGGKASKPGISDYMLGNMPSSAVMVSPQRHFTIHQQEIPSGVDRFTMHQQETPSATKRFTMHQQGTSSVTNRFTMHQQGTSSATDRFMMQHQETPRVADPTVLEQPLEMSGIQDHLTEHHRNLAINIAAALASGLA